MARKKNTMTPGQIVGIVFGTVFVLLGIYLVIKYKPKPYRRIKQETNAKKAKRQTEAEFNNELNSIVQTPAELDESVDDENNSEEEEE